MALFHDTATCGRGQSRCTDRLKALRAPGVAWVKGMRLNGGPTCTVHVDETPVDKEQVALPCPGSAQMARWQTTELC